MNTEGNFADLINGDFLIPANLDPRWLNSKFISIKQLDAKVKGKRLEEITSFILNHLDYLVEPSTNTDHDIILDGKKTELKGSTLINGEEDKFSFLQIRPSQDYEQVVFTLVYPEKLELWVLDKESIKTNILEGQKPENKIRARRKKGDPKKINKFIKPQHGGNDGNSGTYCFHGHPKTLGATQILRKFGNVK